VWPPRERDTERAMSRNVALIQRAYRLWNAGDMEAAKRMYTPDAMMSTPPDWPDSITSNDRDEMFNRLVENRDLFESDRLIPEQWIEAGNCVIVPTQWCGVPKGASAELKVSVVPAYTVRGVRIVRLDWYSSVQEALEAVGRAG
jgi:ketosteroid isomerase-like protein